MKWTLEKLDKLEYQIECLYQTTALTAKTLADVMGKIDTERLKINQSNGVVNRSEKCDFHSVSDIKNFIDWEEKQNKDYLGGKFMYDIKGYYKRLSEDELFDYWLERVHSH